jgi:uncharacterized damage-inducible protein DinB
MSSDLTRLRRLLEYDGWANAAALASLSEGEPAQARRWLAHIIGAEWLWLARLRDKPSHLPAWPDLDVTQCAAELAELQAEWTRYLVLLTDEDLADGVAYRNSLGEFWTSTVGDILTHVVVHAAYHRGQIASAVRAGGGTPAYTDFIHAVRQGLVE